MEEVASGLDLTLIRKLRVLIMEYEDDPNHTITQEHVKVRNQCCLFYGFEFVREAIKEIYYEIRLASHPEMFAGVEAPTFKRLPQQKLKPKPIERKKEKQRDRAFRPSYLQVCRSRA